MSRKKNRNNNNTSKPKEKRDEEFSPFSSIVLKEKKEEPKKSTATKKVAPSGKRPQQIVQGYDPKASFSDILYNWEHTGELYAMPKPKASVAGARTESKQSFGDILAAWEGKTAPKTPLKGPVKRVSPEYKATKDFGSILDQYEGKAPSKPVQKREEPAADMSTPAAVEQKAEDRKPLNNPFFREKEEDDERPSAVAWSIFGDNRKRDAKEELQPESVSEKPAEEKPVYKRATPEYRPSEDFGAILDKYEGRVRARVEEPVVPEAKPVEAVKEEEQVEVTTFFKNYEDEERPAEVAWSVLGGNREIKRPEMEKKKTAEVAEAEEKPPVHKEEVKPSPLFQKSVSSIDTRTFDEILKEKGDTALSRKEKSINEIRMMLPQSTLDLHGMTQAEAETAIISFLEEASSSSLEKVAIIHGKGLHAEDGQGVLKDLTYRLCQNSELIREYTVPKAQYGGSGALWIILKKRKIEDTE